MLEVDILDFFFFIHVFLLDFVSSLSIIFMVLLCYCKYSSYCYLYFVMCSFSGICCNCWVTECFSLSDLFVRNWIGKASFLSFIFNMYIFFFFLISRLRKNGLLDWVFGKIQWRKVNKQDIGQQTMKKSKKENRNKDR